MADDNEVKLDYMADRIAAKLMGQHNMLPATAGQLQACGMGGMPTNGCENLNYAPITTQRFYRAARTDLSVIVEGQIPVAPGGSVLLSQDAKPPWPTGCFSLRYRLANNGNNHDEIRITWFMDDEELDTKIYGQRDLQPRQHDHRRRPAAGPAGDGPALLRRRHEPPARPDPAHGQQQPDREHPPVRSPRQGDQVLLVVRDGPRVRLRRRPQVTEV
jgi:hypothetical protein